MDWRDKHTAKRGWCVEVVLSTGKRYFLGSGSDHPLPWVYATREAADRAAEPSCPRCRSGLGRVVECHYYPVEILDPNPNDPGDPIRQRIAEKSAAGETR